MQILNIKWADINQKYKKIVVWAVLLLAFTCSLFYSWKYSVFDKIKNIFVDKYSKESSGDVQILTSNNRIYSGKFYATENRCNHLVEYDRVIFKQATDECNLECILFIYQPEVDKNIQASVLEIEKLPEQETCGDMRVNEAKIAELKRACNDIKNLLRKEKELSCHDTKNYIRNFLMSNHPNLKATLEQMVDFLTNSINNDKNVAKKDTTGYYQLCYRCGISKNASILVLSPLKSFFKRSVDKDKTSCMLWFQAKDLITLKSFYFFDIIKIYNILQNSGSGIKNFDIFDNDMLTEDDENQQEEVINKVLEEENRAGVKLISPEETSVSISPLKATNECNPALSNTDIENLASNVNDVLALLHKPHIERDYGSIDKEVNQEDNDKSNESQDAECVFKNPMLQNSEKYNQQLVYPFPIISDIIQDNTKYRGEKMKVSRKVTEFNSDIKAGDVQQIQKIDSSADVGENEIQKERSSELVIGGTIKYTDQKDAEIDNSAKSREVQHKFINVINDADHGTQKIHLEGVNEVFSDNHSVGTHAQLGEIDIQGCFYKCFDGGYINSEKSKNRGAQQGINYGCKEQQDYASQDYNIEVSGANMDLIDIVLNEDSKEPASKIQQKHMINNCANTSKDGAEAGTRETIYDEIIEESLRNAVVQGGFSVENATLVNKKDSKFLESDKTSESSSFSTEKGRPEPGYKSADKNFIKRNKLRASRGHSKNPNNIHSKT